MNILVAFRAEPDDIKRLRIILMVTVCVFCGLTTLAGAAFYFPGSDGIVEHFMCSTPVWILSVIAMIVYCEVFSPSLPVLFFPKAIVSIIAVFAIGSQSVFSGSILMKFRDWFNLFAAATLFGGHGTRLPWLASTQSQCVGALLYHRGGGNESFRS